LEERLFTPESHGRGSGELVGAPAVEENTMAGAAERIGTAVGIAQREIWRGFELVRGTGKAAEAEQPENAFRQTRRQAAERLDEWSEQASERLQELKVHANSTLSRSRLRLRQLTDAYPLQTIAVVAAISFILGAALRMRRSHHG
jgi:ElaB/YqjD/DUF883 family membrane-anchored ribosome-binding protein